MMERMLSITDRYGWMFAACLLLFAAGCYESQASNNPPKFQPADEPKKDPPVNPAVNTPETPETPEKPVEPMPPEEPPTEPVEEKIPEGFPYRFRYTVPDFPAGAEWVNTKPLSQADLKGKFVLLDFWTYCCINCIHILPELKELEQKYPNQLVVVGVHCAKFDAEEDVNNITNAVLRYEIEHPVINDPEHEFWQAMGVNSWPTVALLDPEGKLVWGRSGEFDSEEVAEVLDKGIEYFRKEGTLKEAPMKFELERDKLADSPLRFPGKIVADEKGQRLFISDSNHNRIVVTDLGGKVQSVIGSGKQGREDGPAATASFHHPQGMALSADEQTLYVADTENHMLRKVDLAKAEVKTIAGIGEQAHNAWPGIEKAANIDSLPERFVGPPATTALNSPWDLWINDQTLYIAMAGPHQIWSMPLDESEIGPFAGNSAEDIVDGPHLPKLPTARSFGSSFAQPSGLSSDGKNLFVADSEGSSIRRVPFDPKEDVTTVVGSNNEIRGRLFDFGDVDGLPGTAKLQHALGVCYVDGKIYVTDTYNNKIKVVDAETGETKTLAGDRERGKTDDPPRFNEPAGISQAGGVLYIADTNNHLIRTLEIATGKVGTLAITGLPGKDLTVPGVEAQGESKPVRDPAVKPVSATALAGKEVELPPSTVKAEEGKVGLHVTLVLPKGWKINPIAPMAYQVEFKNEKGLIDRKLAGKHKLDKPVATFDVPLPVAGDGEDTVNIALRYYYCEDVKEEDATCKIGNVTFIVPLKISADGKGSTVEIQHVVE